MSKYEEKMSPMGRLILFIVLATIIFLVVLMEMETQNLGANAKSGNIGKVSLTK